ncbi:MAG: bifunctional 5,10-methylenetetrahydrofolate dehydrogenase/5,10-methenyltetrahydrofolate cyclohydrolase [Clostridiales Family XIII bacterium]|jgi:methylenetetrahydrofolate dehydrogenase (NADP+)/methenyltetrahydrofolate cyclohydrolase|nr:bifunctional 5,10-methylenetetrahydrofolate dehydrogenase/5,10-methenyltetrahydrofolate cyclohydrolase [Clostridiales Family XIII bacterium]
MSAKLLDGKQLRDEMMLALKVHSEKLSQSGNRPTLAVLRVGTGEEDMAYERVIVRTAENVGVTVRLFDYPESITQEELAGEVRKLNIDHSVAGLLLFRPLPGHIRDKVIRSLILPCKDVDGITDTSMGMIYADGIRDVQDGEEAVLSGFAPCTAEAVIRMLKHYGVRLEGKRAAVVGRSVVIGKPVSMLLMKENATVTMCHSKTRDLAEITRQADIVVVAAGLSGGRAGRLGAEYFAPGQIVIDVGIHCDEDGLFYGDVNTEEAAKIVEGITPVPGGLGAVTAATLFEHVLEATEYLRSASVHISRRWTGQE